VRIDIFGQTFPKEKLYKGTNYKYRHNERGRTEQHKTKTHNTKKNTTPRQWREVATTIFHSHGPTL